jgi:hypothetical protein
MGDDSGLKPHAKLPNSQVGNPSLVGLMIVEKGRLDGQVF